ncbi:hypothetical protein N9O93_00300 [bacterium]|nr:hypothetical protein [bacterium]
MAVEFNIDGQNYRFPDWATESTMESVNKTLQEIAKNNGVDSATLKQLSETNKKLLKQLEKDAKASTTDEAKTVEQNKEQIKTLDEVVEKLTGVQNEIKVGNQLDKKEYKSFASKVIDDFENTGEQLVGVAGQVGGMMVKTAGLAVGAVATGFGIVAKALHGAGGAINELTKAGIGFSSTYDDVGMSTTQAIGNLGALGDGFAGAAQRMAKSSSVIATQGFGRFTDTMKFAADTSEELGMSFEDSMDRFGDALTRRQKMMNLGNIDQGKLNQQINRTTKAQQAYSTALGVGTEEMQNFVDGLLNNNGVLMSSMLRFSDSVRGDLVAGIEVFASGMAAMGGQAGQDIATAFTEAAATGSIGLSEAAIGMVTALPNLAGPMKEYIGAVQAGTLSQEQSEEMVQNMTKQLGNLSQSEKERIRLMARTGDVHAQSMANAIAQFEQSESKMAEINKALGTGFNLDMVQKGTNQFNKVMAQISGGAQNAFYSLFADSEVTGALTEGFEDILKIFGFGVDSMSGAAQGVGGTMADLAKKFVPYIKLAVEQLKVFATYLKEAFQEGGFKGVITTVLGDIKSALVPSFGTVIKWLAGGILAVMTATILKTAAIQSASAVSFWASQKVAAGASKVKDMLFGGAKEAAGDFIGPMPEGMSRTGSSIGEKAGNILGGESTKADAITGKMTKGGKSGGFLGGIADAVKKFGDTKVLKGAAAIALLGASVGLAAVGLRTFNDVDFTSIIKGTAALGGLALLAKTLGKSSSAMVKGAAAILLLGAAVVPLAFGLSLMKDVGLGTIGVLAAGLITLGAAAAILSFASPFILTGAVAIAALGLALIPFGIALNLVANALPVFVESLGSMSEVDGGGLLKASGGMLAMAGAMALMAPLLPFMLLGSLAAPSIETLGKALQTMNGVDFANLAQAGVAMTALGAGMAVMSGGSLMSGIADGIGGLFGADSPIEKIQKFIKGFEDVNTRGISQAGFALETVAESMQVIGDQAGTLKPVADDIFTLGFAFDKIDTDSFAKFGALGDQAEGVGIFATSTAQLSDALYDISGITGPASDGFFELASSIHAMAIAMDELSVMDVLKLGALKMIGPSKQDIAKQHTPTPAKKPAPATDRESAMADTVASLQAEQTDTADRESEMVNAIAEIKAENEELTAMVMVKGEGVKKLTSAEIKEGMASGKITRSLGRNAQRDIKMQEQAAQIPDDGTGKKSGTFKNGVLVPTPESNVALNKPVNKAEPELDMFGDVVDPNEKIDLAGTTAAYEKRFGVDKSSFRSKQADGSKFQIGNQPGNTEPKGISTGTGIDKASFGDSKSKITPAEGGRKKSSMADDFSKEMSPPTATPTATPGDDKLDRLIALQTENNMLLKKQTKATKELDA